VVASIFSEIENHQQMTMQIPEGPRYTLNISHENQRKRVNVSLLCVRDNLATSLYFSIQYILFCNYFWDAFVILNGHEITS
jgi:hypothetical protein